MADLPATRSHCVRPRFHAELVDIFSDDIQNQMDRDNSAQAKNLKNLKSTQGLPCSGLEKVGKHLGNPRPWEPLKVHRRIPHEDSSGARKQEPWSPWDLLSGGTYCPGAVQNLFLKVRPP